MITRIKQHPLIAFFILTYFYSWFAAAVLLSGLVTPFGEWTIFLNEREIEKVRLWRTLIIWGPNLSAMTILGLTEGKGAIKVLFSKFFKWNVGYRWWCASIGVPLGLAFISIYIHVILGNNLDLKNLGYLPIIFVLLLLQSTTESGIGEEAGWRGFALPRLQATHGALVSSLIVGIIWAFWHAPLFFVLKYSLNEILGFVIMIVSLSVIYTWIYNGTKGSLLMIAIIHNVGNTIDATLSTRGSSYGALLTEQSLSSVFIPILICFAVLVILLTKGRLGLEN